jgi:hypothetical protein
MTKSNRNNKRVPHFVLQSPTVDELFEEYRGESGIFTTKGFLPGGGREHFSFPSDEETQAFARGIITAPGYKIPSLKFKGGQRMIDAGALRPFNSKLFPIPQTLRLKATEAPQDNVSVDRQAAYAWAVAMNEDQWKRPIWELFENDHRTLVDDKGKLPPEYQTMAESLDPELSSAEDFVVKNLPGIAVQLQEHNPTASAARIYQAALQILGQIPDLQKAFSTIQLWTIGFRQYTNPKLAKKMELFRSMLEAYFILAYTGELRLDKVEDKAALKQVVDSINLKVGHALLPVLVDAYSSGPAVIPIVTGMFGPIGGHLAFIPWNIFEQLMALVDAIYKHEGGHLLQADIVKYVEEAMAIIVKTITEEGPKLGLKDVMAGKQQLPTIQFWISVFIGQFMELDADSWMLRASGPEAARKCFSTFLGAMQGKNVQSLDKVKAILRNYSSYTLKPTKDGKGASMKFEPHPQDNVRIGMWMAFIAILMGYPEVAKEMQAYAAKESNNAKTVKWSGEVEEADAEGGDDDGGNDGSQGLAAKKRSPKKSPRKRPGKSTGKTTGKSSGRSNPNRPKSEDEDAPTDGKGTTKQPEKPELPVIEVSVEDYGKVAEVVCNALHTTPMPSLGGRTMLELVCLTPEMHEQSVEPVIAVLMQEENNDKLPETGHRHYPNTIGSAAIIAEHRLIEKGWDPIKARKHVESGAEAMMFEWLPGWLEQVKRLGLRDPIRPTESQA